MDDYEQWGWVEKGRASPAHLVHCRVGIRCDVKEFFSNKTGGGRPGACYDILSEGMRVVG
jgi:hypothetical protein